MEKTTIESNNGKINSTAKMLKIKAEFMEMGIKLIPRLLVNAECSFKPYSKEWVEWQVSCSNVWALRNSDPDIIKAFGKALIKEKNRIDDINVIVD